jgi:hypothetical protein
MDSQLPTINLKEKKLLSFNDFYDKILERHHEDIIIDPNCLIGMFRIKKAIRFENCYHMECYDEDSVKEKFKGKHNFRCLKCGNLLSLSSLKYDGFFTALLNYTPGQNKKIILRKKTKKFEFVEEIAADTSFSQTINNGSEFLNWYLPILNAHHFIFILDLDKSFFNLNLFYTCEKINMGQNNMLLLVNFSNKFNMDLNKLFPNSNIFIIEICSLLEHYESLDEFKKTLILSELIFYIETIKIRFLDKFKLNILFIQNEEYINSKFGFLFKDKTFTQEKFIQMMAGTTLKKNYDYTIIKDSDDIFSNDNLLQLKSDDSFLSIEVLNFLQQVFMDGEKNAFTKSESEQFKTISIISKETFYSYNSLKFYIVDRKEIYYNISNRNEEFLFIFIEKNDFPRIFYYSKINEKDLLFNQFLNYVTNRNFIVTNSNDFDTFLSLKILTLNSFETYCQNIINAPMTVKNKLQYIFLDSDINLDCFLSNSEKSFTNVEQVFLKNLYNNPESEFIIFSENVTREKKIFKCLDHKQNIYYFFLESENRSANLIYDYYEFIYNEMLNALNPKFYNFYEDIEIFLQGSSDVFKNSYKIKNLKS